MVGEATAAEQTRARMKRTALALFTEHGYGGASIAMIAAALGLTKAAVTYHFPTKEDLLAAVVAPAFSDLDTFFTEVGSEPLKPARRREAIAEYVRLMVKHRDLLAFVSKEGTHETPDSIGHQWWRISETVEHIFGGDRADLTEHIYFRAVVRGLALAPGSYPELDDDTLYEHLLQATQRIFARPRRR